MWSVVGAENLDRKRFRTVVPGLRRVRDVLPMTRLGDRAPVQRAVHDTCRTSSIGKHTLPGRAWLTGVGVEQRDIPGGRCPQSSTQRWILGTVAHQAPRVEHAGAVVDEMGSRHAASAAPVRLLSNELPHPALERSDGVVASRARIHEGLNDALDGGTAETNVFCVGLAVRREAEAARHLTWQLKHPVVPVVGNARSSFMTIDDILQQSSKPTDRIVAVYLTPEIRVEPRRVKDEMSSRAQTVRRREIVRPVHDLPCKKSAKASFTTRTSLSGVGSP